MILTFRPIKVWPDGWQDARRSRSASPFRATHSDTLQLLDRELRHLGASSVTLQVDASERDCRLDGQLRADAKVRHPGVILTIETKKFGTLVYPCDAFTGGYWGSRRLDGWQANLRAIALGLEALRKVERYGITHRDEQYAGWKAIGSGTAMGARMSKDEAAKVLADLSGEPMDGGDIVVNLKGDVDLGTVERAYKSAAKIHHPDRGGNPDLMARATEARDVLVAP